MSEQQSWCEVRDVPSSCDASRALQARNEVNRLGVPRQTWSALTPLLITAFLDMMGVLIVVPLLPIYARSFGAGGFFVSVLVAVFTTAQLLSAPMWGRASDRYGRRPVLLWGLGATALASLVFAVATSPLVLLLSRVAQGMGGGTTGVIQAYVADTVDAHDRAKVLGWVSSATSLGMVLGPPAGAFALRVLGPLGPGVVAAVLCGLNICFARKYLPESRRQEPRLQEPLSERSSDESRTTSFPPTRLVQQSWGAWSARVTMRQQTIAVLMGTYAIALGAYQGIMALLLLWLADTFQVRMTASWIVFSYIGGLAVVLRAGPVGWAVTRYGERVVTQIGVIVLAVGCGILPSMPTLAAEVVALALLPIGAAFTFPAVTALLLRVLTPVERGVYLGVQQTVGGVARVGIPLWAGFAYDHIGHSVPFWTMALLLAGTLPFGFGLRA